eukprot:323982_1
MTPFSHVTLRNVFIIIIVAVVIHIIFIIYYYDIPVTMVTDIQTASSRYNASKYIINIKVKHYESDTPSIFLNGMLQYYWINEWKITTERIRLDFNDPSMPLIVKRYFGQISSRGLHKQYNLFSWGDILLEINIISSQYNTSKMKNIYLAIAADDEYCQRNWKVFGHNMLIKSRNYNDSYYFNNSYYDKRFANLRFNISSVPIIASQIYHPYLPKHITYLPLFIHQKLGKYKDLKQNIIKSFVLRTYDYNAMIGLSSGWRNAQLNFWNDLKLKNINDTKVIVHLDEYNKPDSYTNILSESKYTLCPSGNNPESYRLWESMFFGSIPIVAIDIEYFTHPCRNSYSFIIHYVFSLEYHTFLLKLNQTQCENMLICWSKLTAIQMLQKSIDSFIPVIVITEWNIELYEQLLNDMLNMDAKYWNQFQNKMMKWMDFTIKKTFQSMLNNILHYIDSRIPFDDIDLNVENVKIHQKEIVSKNVTSSHVIIDFYNKSYAENLERFLLKENRQITLLINSCYHHNGPALNRVILSIFKYINLGLIDKMLIIDNCVYPKLLNHLHYLYGNHFEIESFGNYKLGDLIQKDNIIKTVNYSFSQIKTNWVLYIGDYWEFDSYNFISDAFMLYEQLLDNLVTNVIVQCNHDTKKVGLMPIFIYYNYLKNTMQKIWFGNNSIHTEKIHVNESQSSSKCYINFL